MSLRLIAFTARGAALARRLADALEGDAQVFGMGAASAAAGVSPVEDLRAWARESWGLADGLVFVGATGIAVRTIAPWLRGKALDPAVVVMDEAGRFAISLISGHLGGANELARRLAALTGATAVITTATDVNARFAVDVFARDNNLHITSMELAKEISAAVLAGERVGLFTKLPIDGKLPDELTLEVRQRLHIEIAVRRSLPDSLLLAPRCVVVGIGCKRGASATIIEAAVNETLAHFEIPREALCGLASIDVKRDEEGLLAFAEEAGLPIGFCDAASLNAVPGEFSGSGFVKKTVGVDCVCERAAVLGAGGGELIVRKQTFAGVTVALAERETRLRL